MSVLAAALALNDVDSADDIDRAGSELVDRRGAPMRFIEAPLTSYAITYRVEVRDKSSATENRIVVDRPWRSVTTDDVVTRRSGFGVLGNRPSGDDAVGFVVPPALAAGDARPQIALPAAIDAGVVDLGERRRVLGTECQVYRTALPLAAGPISAPGDDRTESCIDGRGLALEELLVVDDEPVQRRVAISVSSLARLTSADVAVPAATVSVDDGGAGLRKLDGLEVATLAPRWELNAPTGFTLHGRYAVVHPRDDATGEPGMATSRLATLMTVWTRGVEVIIFETGSTLDGSPVAPAVGAAETVEWPSTAGTASPGLAQLLVSARGNELRNVNGGELVRLMATAPPDELLAIAASISPTGARS